MQTLKSLVPAVLVMAVAALAIGSIAAQDPAKVAPDHYKCIFENDSVRVCEVTMKPGEKIATHSHPDHFLYVQEAGKMKVTKADGKSKEVEMKVGEVLWTPAETHSAENTGATTIKGLVIELKE